MGKEHGIHRMGGAPMSCMLLTAIEANEARPASFLMRHHPLRQTYFAIECHLDHHLAGIPDRSRL